MEASELKPCPFCGGAMAFKHDHTAEDVDYIQHVLPSISCPISGASGLSIGNDQLVEAWNTRAADEQSIRDAITEDRRGRTFTTSELDRARALGMEQAAVIADDAKKEWEGAAKTIAINSIVMEVSIQAAEIIGTAIRAAKGTGHAG